MRPFSSILSATFLVKLALLLTATTAIEWLGLHKHQTTRHWNRTADCRFPSKTSSRPDRPRTKTNDLGGRSGAQYHYQASSAAETSILVHGQRRLCTRYIELMPAVVQASQVTIEVCQALFNDNRWNCSSVSKAPYFTPDLTSGSREQAFVVALAAASLSQTVAKACSSGVSNKCGCAGPSQTSSPPPLTSSTAANADPQTGDQQQQARVTSAPAVSGASQKHPSSDFQWGGCGDDLAYGLSFGQTFGASRWVRRKPSLKSLTDLHNQRVGRKMLAGSLMTSCKCHGVSGSCALKTCWRALPVDMRGVGGHLLRAYHDSAVEVTSLKPISGQRPMSLVGVRTGNEIGDDWLAFYSLSPDYCLADPSLGSVGTQGRECLKDHPGGAGCRSMCCGRRYTTETVVVRYRCDCKYYWCCYVKCRICSKQVDVHRCT